MRSIRWIVAISVVLAVFAGLFVIADRVALSYARDAVADQVAAELDDYAQAPDPDVEIAGFPFLTQAASGTYEEINIDLGTTDVEEFTLHDAELTASSVSAPMSAVLNGEIHAERLSGSAVVGYAGIAASTGIDGLELSPGGGGQIALRVPAGSLIEALDFQGTGTIEGLLERLVTEDTVLVGAGSVRIDDQMITLTVEELAPENPDDLPAPFSALLDDMADAAVLGVAMPPLPYDLRLTELRPAPEGIAISLSAQDVPLSR